MSALTASVLVASVFALVLTAWLERLSRRTSVALLSLGLVALVATALAPDLAVLGIVVLTVALAQVGFGPARWARPRLQRQAVGGVLIGLSALLLRSQASTWVPRVGAATLVMGLVLCIGLFPQTQRLELRDATAISSASWLGLLGPLTFVVFLQRAVTEMRSDVGGVFAALLIAFGVLNTGFGVVSAWRAREPAETWHGAFVAEWGLILVAAGLLLPSGLAAAYLLLLGLLVCRLPIFATASSIAKTVSPPAQEMAGRIRPLALAATAALSGAAPFAGFPARILLLRAAVSLSWVLAAWLFVGLVLWLLHALQVARALDLSSRREWQATAAALVVSLAIGVYPAPFLAAAGLS